MKVVLRSDVDNLGSKGEVVDVADGYARNYLVPRGLAETATRGALRQAETVRRAREAREAHEREVAETLAGRLNAQTVRVSARAGEGGKLFGSVTATDIADAVHEQLQVDLDRRKLDLGGEPIKDLGTHEVSLRIHPEVEATFHVVVIPQA